LGVDISLSSADAGTGQSADEPQRGRADARAGQGCEQPSGGHHRADAGQRQGADPSQQSGAATQGGAKDCTRAAAGSDIRVCWLDRASRFGTGAGGGRGGGRPIGRICDQADLTARDAGVFQLGD
jgi:hypothetical protein